MASIYLVNVHFGHILHTFILHFTLHSAEKNPHRIFRKLPLNNFPHSAKYPFLYDIQRRRNARNQHHFSVVIVLSAASLLFGNYKCKFLADVEENTNKLHLYLPCMHKITIIINIIKSSL